MRNRLNTLLIILMVLVSGSKSLAQWNTTVTAFAVSLELEKKKDYVGAIKTIAELRDSSSYEYNLRLGWLNYKAGFKKKSLVYYNTAIQLMPNAIEPRIGFGFPAYMLEDFSDLIAQYNKVLEIDPNHKNTLSNLGQIYYYDKQYKKALPYFQKVVSQYPFDYDNNLLLGWTYLYLGKNTEAEQMFQLVLLYSPGDASAKQGLETLSKPIAGDAPLNLAFERSYELSAASDYKGAAAALKSAYDKTSYAMNVRLGWLYYLAGLHTDALAHYKIATELKTTSIESRLGAANAAEAMGNKNELKLIYEGILTLDPQNSYVNYKLGYLHYERKEFDKAYVYFEKVYKLYPFDYDGLLMYAWATYQTGKTAEARVLFNKVLCLVPTDRSALLGLKSPGVEEQKKMDAKSPIQIK